MDDNNCQCGKPKWVNNDTCYECTEETLVVFRKWRDDGQIIAIFPHELGTNDYGTCSSYMHVGQHGSCDPAIVHVTDLATPEEYADLKAELKSIGYKLKIGERIPRNAIDIRREKLKEFYND